MIWSEITGAEKHPLIDREPQLFKLNMTPGGHPVYMWRDDPTAFAFGGNKVRFYEYLIPEIKKEAPEIILTSGSLHSNHIRVTAEVCALLGIECILLITGDRPETDFMSTANNLSIAATLGAKLEFIGSFAAMLKIGEYASALKATGRKVFVVPNAGHTPQAIGAFADVVSDALDKLDAAGITPAHIYLPCASGTTMSGILSGLELLTRSGRAVPPATGIAVGNTPAGCAKGVRSLLRAASKLYPEEQCTAAADVIDCGKNDYGHPDVELLEFRRMISETEGVIIDRTYNLPAFYGMVNALEAAPGDEPVLYINTGGFTG